MLSRANNYSWPLAILSCNILQRPPKICVELMLKQNFIVASQALSLIFNSGKASRISIKYVCCTCILASLWAHSSIALYLHLWAAIWLTFKQNLSVYTYMYVCCLGCLSTCKGPSSDHAHPVEAWPGSPAPRWRWWGWWGERGAIVATIGASPFRHARGDDRGFPNWTALHNYCCITTDWIIFTCCVI